MNRQISPLHVLTLSIALFAFCVSCSNQEETPSSTSSSDEYPFSVLDGRTVRINPYGATFDLPAPWVGPTYGKNLFLSRDELMSINQPDRGRFIYEETLVMNSVLPSSDCAVHAGEKGWDSGVVSDQARAYIVALPLEEVGARIEQDGSRTAGRVFDEATYTASNFGEWRHSTLSYLQTGTHTIMFRDIDFYFRSFGEKTVVFVFTHSVGGTDYIPPILSSFKWHSEQ